LGVLIVCSRLFIMRYIERGYPNGVSNKCDAIPKAATSNLGVDLHDIVLRIAEEQRPVAPSCKIGRLPNCASDPAPIGAIHLIDGGVGILDWAQGDNFAPLSIWNAAVRLMGRRQRCGRGLGEATDSPGEQVGLEDFGVPGHGTEQPYRGEHHGSEGRSACETVRGQG